VGLPDPTPAFTSSLAVPEELAAMLKARGLPARFADDVAGLGAGVAEAPSPRPGPPYAT
jgi:hypothetical protein